MTPVAPTVPEGSRLVVYAKDQQEYDPLPASVDGDGVVTTEWELSDDERWAIFAGARVRLSAMTFGMPLQPVRLEVLEPDCVVNES